MTKDSKKSRKLGLWIPRAVQTLPFLSAAEKLLYAYMYSFAERGCWQTDQQIGEALGCCGRTVRRYLANCKKAGLLKVIGEGSKHRRIWAKDNPRFKADQKIWAKEHGQSCPGTIKGTNKSTNKERGGSPSPAKGQAHAPRTKEEQLEAHGAKEQATASIERVKHHLGRGRRTPELTPAQREESRQRQRKALLAD